jgi:RNA polymerase sigma-70 factor (ECF subfamily)
VRGLPSFDQRSSFGTWVYRIATNTSLDELRKRRRRPQLQVVDPADAPEIVDDVAERRVEVVADRLAIDAAVAALPDDFRTAVVLRDVADLEYAEIADALGIPVGTVKSRIARGRALLAEHLGNQEPLARRPTQDP